MHTVESLRKQGFKVYVRHHRDINSDGSIATKGGMTWVEVIEPNGDGVGGDYAYCSDQDVYSKKLGVRIALGRVMKHYQPSNHSFVQGFPFGN